jgi:hypothetical protein
MRFAYAAYIYNPGAFHDCANELRLRRRARAYWRVSFRAKHARHANAAGASGFTGATPRAAPSSIAKQQC